MRLTTRSQGFVRGGKNEWLLTESAVRNGIQSTTRYRTDKKKTKRGRDQKQQPSQHSATRARQGQKGGFASKTSREQERQGAAAAAAASGHRPVPTLNYRPIKQRTPTSRSTPAIMGPYASEDLQMPFLHDVGRGEASSSQYSYSSYSSQGATAAGAGPEKAPAGASQGMPTQEATFESYQQPGDRHGLVPPSYDPGFAYPPFQSDQYGTSGTSTSGGTSSLGYPFEPAAAPGASGSGSFMDTPDDSWADCSAQHQAGQCHRF